MIINIEIWYQTLQSKSFLKRLSWKLIWLLWLWLISIDTVDVLYAKKNSYGRFCWNYGKKFRYWYNYDVIYGCDVTVISSKDFIKVMRPLLDLYAHIMFYPFFKTRKTCFSCRTGFPGPSMLCLRVFCCFICCTGFTEGISTTKKNTQKFTDCKNVDRKKYRQYKISTRKNVYKKK